MALGSGILTEPLVDGQLVLGAQPRGAPGDGEIFLVEALAGGKQLPGHAEVDLGSGDSTGEEVVEPQEEQRLTQRRIFREQQEEARPRLRPLLRDAYEQGATSDWSDLLRRPQEPELDLEGNEGLLEAATPETYLAVSRYDLPPIRA
ncbi:hypothetical protein [Streptomyces sp. UH6]|uniref:hypothetical protein n=1 Tax=Streptomyces sp. UH6 TaxID=2748379 RepID=UPI00211EF1D1|nr:hypothetical protein [Streptomyces sp. UH6]